MWRRVRLRGGTCWRQAADLRVVDPDGRGVGAADGDRVVAVELDGSEARHVRDQARSHRARALSAANERCAVSPAVLREFSARDSGDFAPLLREGGVNPAQQRN